MTNRIRTLLGVALVIIGALFLIVAYLVGWTSSNLILLIGLIIIVLGVILHVKLTKSGEKY
ncbi:MAG: hypothetical protein J6W38_12905 [Prevotella sp.]|nr:hypothetical protein [Prevotella sp.]MBO7130052.1 hypothetical protein [Prevotella sp.]